MDLDRLKEDLVRDEGKRLVAYRDSNGFYTIGVGHLLGPEARMTTITEAECDALLTADIQNAERAVSVVFGVLSTDPWPDARMRALVNMAFNRGEAHMRNSTTITPAIMLAMKDGNWSPVYDAIMASPWAAQIGARAARIAYMLRFGKDPTP